jgi:hypothetical protein
MAEKSDAGMTFVCHYGLERSRAAAEAYRSLGVDACHFVGGTKRIASMPLQELKSAFPKNSTAILIYDQRSGDDEYKRKMDALDKLNALGIDYEVVDTATLAIMLLESGRNIDDFL